MLISVKNLKSIFKVHPIGTLHVGAHKAEEAADYEKFEFTPVVWIEAQEDLIRDCRLNVKKFPEKNHKFFQGLIWNEDNILLDFHKANHSQSSSLFEFARHKKLYPEIESVAISRMRTITLAKLLPDNVEFDFINLDIQGSELQALQGLGERIRELKWIYVEVNKKEIYKGIPLVSDLDKFLKNYSFFRVVTKWVAGSGWGDALYMRSDIYFGLSKIQQIQIYFTKCFYLLNFKIVMRVFQKFFFEIKHSLK